GADLAEGDVVLINDPYLGGSHLMDTKLVAPFFYKGKRWCFLSNAAHWADIGGSVPGGFATGATEIHQEGLRIPPVKLYRKGELCQDILDIVLSNIRVPEERIGDIRAQMGAIKVGERRLTALLDRYGAEQVARVIDELEQRSEQQMRAHIDTVPDGTYRFSAYLDSDGVDEGKLTIALSMKVEGSDIYFDLSESSPPCRGPMNSVWAQTQTAIYVGMKHIFPDVPINAGCFKPLHIEPPDGTFLHAVYPSPVSGCAAEVSQRIMEALFGAMGEAIPDRMFAAPFSTAGNFSLGGYDPKRDRHYVMYFFSGGGYGASREQDGLSNGASSIGVARTTPIEVLEQRYPILVEKYALRDNSGGPGRHRGGLGITYRCRLLGKEARASFLMDHGLTGPHGLLGGGEGARTDIVVCQSGKTFRTPHLSKGENIRLKAGDWVEVETPGGGGYGPPRERDTAAIKHDLLRGYAVAEDGPAINDPPQGSAKPEESS
ncbi:MAG: hydantoinase B/oxoprolinase family protein, partial [Hyphomicrobiales bacterium]|nr:hydantoinase B/oxoprolinase family protein [Hyphomicrobiales bacterium]